MIGRGTVGTNSLVAASNQLVELTLPMFRAVFAMGVESTGGSEWGEPADAHRFVVCTGCMVQAANPRSWDPVLSCHQVPAGRVLSLTWVKRPEAGPLNLHARAFVSIGEPTPLATQ
jgi:hypothetical protein